MRILLLSAIGLAISFLSIGQQIKAPVSQKEKNSTNATGSSKSIVDKSFIAGNWEVLSQEGLSPSSNFYLSIAFDEKATPYITCKEIGNDYCSIKRFNGESWDDLGSTDLKASTLSVVVDGSGTPYVLVNEKNGEKTIRRYDGKSWEKLGHPGTNKYPFTMAFDRSGTPYIAYNDFKNGNPGYISVKKYIDNRWVYVGKACFSEEETYDPQIAIASNGTPYVLYKIGGMWSYKHVIKRLNGENWVTVGQPGLEGGWMTLAIDVNSTPSVLYFEHPKGASVKKFDGNNWVYVGKPAFSPGEISTPSMGFDKDGTLYVAFLHYHNGGGILVKKFNGRSWEQVGKPILSVTPYEYGISMAVDKYGIPYIIYDDVKNGKMLTVKKFKRS